MVDVQNFELIKTIVALALLSPGIHCVMCFVDHQRAISSLTPLCALATLLLVFFFPLETVLYWLGSWVIGFGYVAFEKSYKAVGSAAKYPTFKDDQ